MDRSESVAKDLPGFLSLLEEMNSKVRVPHVPRPQIMDKGRGAGKRINIGLWDCSLE